MARNLRGALAQQAKKSRQRFLQSIDRERALATQEGLLTECVLAAATTSFGLEHSLEQVKDLDDYRAAVPIRRYHQLAPWIERAAAGEEAVLTRREPIRFWKAGDPDHPPRKIPLTPAAAHRNIESFLTLQGTELHYYPDLNDRCDTTLELDVWPRPISEFLGSRQVPYCRSSELPVDLRPGRSDFPPPWLPPLQEVVEEKATRLYFLLCYAAGHDLLCMTALHPGRFQQVMATLESQGERLLDELRRGTVLGDKLRPGDPERADRLEGCRQRRGHLQPSDLWPNLKLLSSFGGSGLSRYRALMEDNFCSGFLAMPWMSSEAFLTMTIDEDPICQPLNLRAGVFEFIPSQVEVKADTGTLQFHELELEQTYEVVLTDLAGLYRLATGDMFKVGGFHGLVPRLEFAGRRAD